MIEQSKTQPVIVNFNSTRSGACRPMNRAFDFCTNNYMGKQPLSYVKVDIDEGSEIAQEYQITSIPTMVIFKDGELV